MKLEKEFERAAPLMVIAFLSLTHLALTLAGLQYIIAPAAPVLIFYGIGFSWRTAYRLLRNREPHAFGTSSGFFADVLLSTVGFSVLASVLTLLWLLTPPTIALAVDGSVILTTAYSVGARRRLPVTEIGRAQLVALGMVVVLGIVGSILFATWRQTTPFPIVSGWDLHAALVSIDFIINHHGFGYLVVPPLPASAIIPYPGMPFHFLAAISVYLGWDPLSVFWWGPWFLLVTCMALIYAVSLRFSKSIVVSLALAVIMGLISGAEPQVVRTLLSVQPDTLAQLILLVIVAWYVYGDDTDRSRRYTSLVAGAFTGIFYFYSVVPTFPFFVAMFIGPRIAGGNRRTFVTFVGCYSLLLVGLGSLAIAGSASPAGVLQFVNPAGFTLALKLEVFDAIYIPVVVALTAFSVIAVLVQRRTFDAKPLSLPYFGVAALALFVAYWMPLWVTYRLELYFRSFLIIFLSGAATDILGASKIVWVRRKRESIEPATASRSRGSATWAMIVVVTAAASAAPLLPVFQASSVAQYATYSLNEYNMAIWIKQNLPSDAYLATDPGSGYVFRDLAQRNASIYFIWSDGRAPSVGDVAVPGIASTVFLAYNLSFEENNSTLAVAYLDSLSLTHVYLLITTRTYYWASHGDENLLETAPLRGQDPLGFAAVFSDPHFNGVVTIGDVCLLSFTPG